MPNNYTHYYFAQKCIDLLPLRLKKIVQENKKIYDIGLSGPDILFYYQPHKANDIKTYGSLMHRKKAKEVFDEFKQIAQKHQKKDMHYAYLTGFFTHFILDSALHGYIWNAEKENIARHFVIEAEYEKLVLKRMGENPFSNKFLRYEINDKDTREVVAQYMNTTPKNIGKILKSRKSFIYCIYTQNIFVRGLLKFLFKLSKNPKAMDILMQKKDNHACIKTSQDLDVLCEQTLNSFAKYAKEFENYLLNDMPLSDRFDVDFE